MKPLETPFALFLTHRRGGVVCLAKDVRSSSSLSEVVTNVVDQEFSEHEGFRSVQSSDVAIVQSVTTTGEVLRKMYLCALEGLSLHDAQVNTFYFGVGPGSFTGLRLGCSFINGLSFARRRALYAIATPHASELLSRRDEFAGSPLLMRELAQFESLDEYTVPTSLCDLVAVARNLSAARQVESLEPAYGKLPGPVIKLNLGLLK